MVRHSASMPYLIRRSSFLCCLLKMFDSAKAAVRELLGVQALPGSGPAQNQTDPFDVTSSKNDRKQENSEVISAPALPNRAQSPWLAIVLLRARALTTPLFRPDHRRGCSVCSNMESKS